MAPPEEEERERKKERKKERSEKERKCGRKKVTMKMIAYTNVRVHVLVHSADIIIAFITEYNERKEIKLRNVRTYARSFLLSTYL